MAPLSGSRSRKVILWIFRQGGPPLPPVLRSLWFTENSFRDVNIAFANELSLVCDRLGINVRELIGLANHHPRVNVLQPGCGVGGHCIAVDPWFIAAEAPDVTPLIQTARRVNDGKSRWVIEQVQTRASALEDQLGRPARIGCLGLAFKPDVDDLRESPALHITTELLASGLEVLACEPNLHVHPTIKLHTLEQVLSEADLLIFLVAHSRPVLWQDHQSKKNYLNANIPGIIAISKELHFGILCWRFVSLRLPQSLLLLFILELNFF